MSILHLVESEQFLLAVNVHEADFLVSPGGEAVATSRRKRIIPPKDEAKARFSPAAGKQARAAFVIPAMYGAYKLGGRVARPIVSGAKKVAGMAWHAARNVGVMAKNAATSTPGKIFTGLGAAALLGKGVKAGMNMWAARRRNRTSAAVHTDRMALPVLK